MFYYHNFQYLVQMTLLVQGDKKAKLIFIWVIQFYNKKNGYIATDSTSHQPIHLSDRLKEASARAADFPVQFHHFQRNNKCYKAFKQQNTFLSESHFHVVFGRSNLNIAQDVNQMTFKDPLNLIPAQNLSKSQQNKCEILGSENCILKQEN